MLPSSRAVRLSEHGGPTTNEWLAAQYKRLNRRWFNGALHPDVSLRWTRGFPHPNQKSIARTTAMRRAGTRTGMAPSGFSITLSRRLRGRSFVVMTLLHEMAHVATWGERTAHGPRWQAEMMRLANIGAFKEWW